MIIPKTKLIMATPMNPTTVDDCRLSMALICFRITEESFSFSTDNAFFLKFMVSCSVLFWGRQIQTHSTVPFVIWTASVSVAFSRLDSVEFNWLKGGKETEVISEEEEEVRGGIGGCDDHEKDVEDEDNDDEDNDDDEYDGKEEEENGDDVCEGGFGDDDDEDEVISEEEEEEENEEEEEDENDGEGDDSDDSGDDVGVVCCGFGEVDIVSEDDCDTGKGNSDDRLVAGNK